MKKNIII